MTEPSIFQNPKSGSIKVTGNYQVVDETGQVITEVSDPKLCGCGLSQDKPFCDKSHANYVSIVTTALENARRNAKAINPFGIWALRANEIRQRSLEHRLAAGENLVGVKFGGALLKKNEGEKRYEGIFGFLTDAMHITGAMKLNEYIHPIAEAEVVFKLAEELNRPIELAEVTRFVSEVAAGIEVFDCRYGAIDPYIDDAIADNACAAGFAIGEWVDAKQVDFENAKITIYENSALNQEVAANSIAGNPWLAVVNASKKLTEAGVKLPKGSIIFSGSATTGIPMQVGNYRVEINAAGIEFGAVEVKVN